MTSSRPHTTEEPSRAPRRLVLATAFSSLFAGATPAHADAPSPALRGVRHRPRARGPLRAVSTAATDWKSVGSALGHPGRMVGRDVYGVGFTRNDAHVVSQGHAIKAIGSFVSFVRYEDGRTLMMGELAVTETELQHVNDVVSAHGITLTSLHKHLFTQEPAIWWVHIHAIGSDPAELARGLRAVLDVTRISRSSAGPDDVSVDLDTAGIDRALGAKGRKQGGVYKVTFARNETVVEHDRALPKMTGSTTALVFQPVGSKKALLSGDLVMTAREVPGTLRALRKGRIDIVSLHNHMLADSPRLFFVHVWAVGDAVRLAGSLHPAVAGTNVSPADSI
ncbi:DUF1259 domain-containing protein [Streptomyces sp. NPDC001262]|uniref:DUF1259 domain-containing protein n=1 Tax=Streptomyces sp. NPDC001262 TaxID=3364552 RepID=UPI00369C1A91